MTRPQKRTALNMRAVALHAGVSSATVSRVINGSAPVSEDVAERVRRSLDELNFIPNPIATALKYGRSKTYGVIVPDLTNPFYAEFLLEFEDALVEIDHELLMATTQSNESKLMSSVRRMLMRRVDGVVLMASELDTKTIEPLFEHRIPIVTIDRRRALDGTSDVGIDFEGAYLKAVVHLHELGHRRIAFIGGNEGIVTSRIRLDAFQKALQQVGIPHLDYLAAHGNYRVSGGNAAMQTLLNAKSRPTAVLTANDLTAFGAMQALLMKGVSVPEEISLVGFDGIQLGAALYPPLTTVAISQRELALTCVRALDHMKADATRRGLSLIVRGSLQLRGSTAPPAATGKAQRQR
jgi:DNA-binding LacI/PurR family transcriptional regulator